MSPMDFCTTRNPENDMKTTHLFNPSLNDGAILWVSLRLIPVTLVLAGVLTAMVA